MGAGGENPASAGAPQPHLPHYDLAVSSPLVLVLAAGEGTRMRSSLPKMLHRVCGRPMVAWPILAAREAGAGRVAVIVSPQHDLSAGLPEGVETVVQPEPDGTGGALRAAIELIRDSETVVVLSGDHPVVSSEAIAGLLAVHRDADAGATVMTAVLEEPGSYGRIVRDPDSGDLTRIVEAKAAGDATPEQLEIREVNTGAYAFAAAPLADALGRIGNENAQGEYYIGDVLPLIREAGLPRPRQRHRGRGRDDRRQHPRRAGAGRGRVAPPHPRGPHDRRGDDRRPGLDLGRRRRRDRGRRPDRARHQPARRTPRSGPARPSARSAP